MNSVGAFWNYRCWGKREQAQASVTRSQLDRGLQDLFGNTSDGEIYAFGERVAEANKKLREDISRLEKLFETLSGDRAQLQREVDILRNVVAGKVIDLKSKDSMQPDTQRRIFAVLEGFPFNERLAFLALSVLNQHPELSVEALIDSHLFWLGIYLNCRSVRE